MEINYEFEKDTPVFHFKDNTQGLVKPIQILIKLLDEERIIWDIRRKFAVSLYSEEKNGLLILKDPRKAAILDEQQAPAVSKLVFGQIPDGFEQKYPVDDYLPRLEPNIKYLIVVLGLKWKGEAIFYQEKK